MRSSGSGMDSSSTPATSGRCRRRSISSPPNGDFRAMPARGEGLAILKWVTSFPGNPRRGLPVVMGVIWSRRRRRRADRAPRRPRRHGACAPARWRRSPPRSSPGRTHAPSASSGAGCTAPGPARCLAAAEYGPGVCFDPDPEAAGQLAAELGWEVGDPRGRARLRRRDLRHPRQRAGGPRGRPPPRQHLNLLGADGPGKAEAELAAIGGAAELFCDEWEQASHGGELTGAVAAGLVGARMSPSWAPSAPARRPGGPRRWRITLFDSTGLAIQDLALCLALIEALRAGRVRADSIRL